MKILITGIAGFIGSNLAIGLLKEGNSVEGIDNLSVYYSSIIKKKNINDIIEVGGRFYYGDINNFDFKEIKNDYDVIIHLAAQPGLSNKTSINDYVNNNIYATNTILDFASKNNNLKLFIYGSTSSIYGKLAFNDENALPCPASYYGVTKLCGENLVKFFGIEKQIPYTILRLFSVYGERERPDKLFPKIFKSILKNKEFEIYDGSLQHQRSFTYIDDIIEGIRLSVNNVEKVNNETFNLGNSKSILMNDALNIISLITNHKLKYRIIDKRVGDQIKTEANINKITKTLGYNNNYSLEEGLTRMWKYFKINND